MSAYLGDFATGVTLDHKFTTVTTTGAPTQLAGTPAISVYKDNSTTQSTSGVTLTVDFDGVTGLNNVRIDTSSDGTFYSAGSNFQIVITTGTVGGTSVVGYVVGSFSLQNRSALRPATAGRNLLVSASGEVRLDATASAAMTENYPADGAEATLAQLLYMIWARLSEFSIAGTTITARKLDGTTTAMTFTLNDASNPSSVTRAS